MCGICGFNWEDKELLKKMISIIHHRGPDQGGVYLDKGISLGHRRLSIIDLSAAGNMPMPNEDGSILIVFNGEIYNFSELRAELEQYYHQFNSNTDTEVIIHGYEQWGEKVVEKLNGQFAFCIYDLKKNKLFLARDRLGIKPLYYYWDEKKFIFASEIKPILLAEVPRIVNIKAAKSYLNLRYVPGEDTLFAGIKKLLPGNTLTLQNGQINFNQFWDVPVPNIKKFSTKNASQTVKGLLTDSVKRRLIADVPVGVYLSGGIDSAAITALATQIKNEDDSGPVKTFSVGFNYNDEVDELTKARKIADHFNTEHHEIVVEDSISETLPKLIWHLDMPHGDPVIIPQFKLSELASKKVKVVLSGEGADEIFAGYVQYKTFLQASKIKLVPAMLKAGLIDKIPVTVLDKFFQYPSSMGNKGKEKVVDFFKDFNNKEKAYFDLTSIMSNKDNQLLFTEKIKEISLNIAQFQQQRKPILNQLLYNDMKKWMPNYVLHINDRMTMAHSIEGRVPFLDHRLVEYSTTLPSKLKINHGQTKHVLRQALKKVLPDTQVKKHAFFMPLDRWYKEELKGLAEELFTHSNVKERGYFNYYYLKKIWDNYSQSKLIHGKQLFTLINFELWQRMFIDAEEIPLNNRIKLSSLL
jgi:asparagine synthase (glutamine-hydrolysing)